METGNGDDVADTAELERSIGFVVNAGTVAQQQSFCKPSCTGRKYLLKLIKEDATPDCRIVLVGN